MKYDYSRDLEELVMNKVLADKGSNHYRLCLDGKLPSDEGALEVAAALVSAVHLADITVCFKRSTF